MLYLNETRYQFRIVGEDEVQPASIREFQIRERVRQSRAKKKTGREIEDTPYEPKRILMNCMLGGIEARLLA